MVKLALFHSFDEKVLPRLCFVLITERQVEHQALCFYFVTPCCSSCNSQQSRLLYSLRFVIVQSLSIQTPNFLIHPCSYCILVLIHGIFLFSNQLYPLHCFVFLPSGKAESGCAAPSVAESSVWGYASSEGDQQMSGVQVSTKYLQLKQLLLSINLRQGWMIQLKSNLILHNTNKKSF